ncbi:hypothetical protein K501DRAFT_288656 [Backusella circina FSU 941]|nr:hypothetical protein K501DRAFT_288656 [Backusella circina FSU 941]
MKLKVNEKQPIQLPYNDDEYETPVHRWMWVRRFIGATVLVTLLVHLFSSLGNNLVQECFVSDYSINQNKKAHTILQTGFPPLENVTGLSIEPQTAAAVAFSPDPSIKSQISTNNIFTDGKGESWWDRLFGKRHVHLKNVQLPVIMMQDDLEASLSICATKREKFKKVPAIPDMKHCTAQVDLRLDQTQVDEDSQFGVLEWIPESVIVLQKSQVYWLVVKTTSESFRWVYAANGISQYGVARETSEGWELSLESDPVPSAMIIVEEH